MLKKYVNIDNTRGEEMRRKWQKIIDDDVDPFDVEHVKKYIGGTIIMESNHWYAFENDHHYEGRKHQIVIVTKKFYIDDDEMSDEEWLDFRKIKKNIKQKFGIIGGGLIMRFGDTDLSGGSVIHLHGQLIVPDEGKKVAAWFGSNKKE